MNTRKVSLFLLGCVLGVASLAAQVGVSPYKSPRVTFTDASGIPLAGGCVFTYAGGTSTPQATFTDYTGSTPNSDPVILDATGSAVMWLGPYTYKFVVWSNGGTNCASGTQEWMVDQVPGNVYLNATLTGATLINPTITGGTIDGTVLGGSSPVSVTANYFSGPIGTGGGAPAPGKFTQVSTPVDSMTFSATPAFLANSYSTFILTLTGNVTSSTITGGAVGQIISFEVCQNATGGYTFAWPSNFVNAPAMPTTPSVCITPQFFFDGASWQYLNNTAASTGGAYSNVTWSATPTFAVNPAFVFGLTLNGSVTSSTITGSVAGDAIGFNLCQNSTGGFAFAWPSGFLNAPAMPLAPSTCITPQFFYSGTNWILLTPNPPLSAQTVTFSTTPAFNAAGYNAFTLTLSANVTSSTIASGVPGQWVSLNICQNTAGGFTFVWPTNLLNAPTITATPSACTDVLAIYNGSNWLTATATGATAPTATNCLTSSTCAGGSTYASGTTYTNHTTYAVTEHVVMQYENTGAPQGCEYELIANLNGSLIANNGIHNDCQGAATDTFTVPPGATFSATVTHITGGSEAFAITAWTETIP